MNANWKPAGLLYGYIGDVPVAKPVMGAGEVERSFPPPDSILGGDGLDEYCDCTGEPLITGDGVFDPWLV